MQGKCTLFQVHGVALWEGWVSFGLLGAAGRSAGGTTEQEAPLCF